MTEPTRDQPREEPSRTEVWKMFDRIAHRYDRLNRVLSLGIDVRWRKAMKKFLPDRGNLRLLDLATGTGDQVMTLVRGSKKIQEAVGMDMAQQMLEVGRKKISSAGLDSRIEMREGDATKIPAEDTSFDVVTISFGIRNVESVNEAMAEMYRVLRPGGRVLILEFSLPPKGLLRSAYLFYLRHILPRIGGMISGDSYAYRYLNETVETFPHGQTFCDMLALVGFQNIKANRLTLGVATIYQGDRLAR